MMMMMMMIVLILTTRHDCYCCYYCCCRCCRYFWLRKREAKIALLRPRLKNQHLSNDSTCCPSKTIKTWNSNSLFDLDRSEKRRILWDGNCRQVERPDDAMKIMGAADSRKTRNQRLFFASSFSARSGYCGWSCWRHWLHWWQRTRRAEREMPRRRARTDGIGMHSSCCCCCCCCCWFCCCFSSVQFSWSVAGQVDALITFYFIICSMWRRSTYLLQLFNAQMQRTLPLSSSVYDVVGDLLWSTNK